MTWQMIAALTPATSLLALAVWRFARLESGVRHQAKCQVLLIKAVSRLGVRQRKTEDSVDKLLRHAGLGN